MMHKGTMILALSPSQSVPLPHRRSPFVPPNIPQCSDPPLSALNMVSVLFSIPSSCSSACIRPTERSNSPKESPKRPRGELQLLARPSAPRESSLVWHGANCGACV